MGEADSTARFSGDQKMDDISFDGVCSPETAGEPEHKPPAKAAFGVLDVIVAPGSPNKSSGAHGHTGHRIGEWHGRAKYSDATVRRARELYAEVGSYKAVGDLLGVPEGTVADWIRRDTRWGAGG
jgi:hypothetical protein